MAEFVLRDMLDKLALTDKIFVASSATSTEEIGNDIHRGTRQILDKYSISYSRREAVQLTRADYERYDYFVGMDTANVRNMHRIFGSDPDGKIIRLLDLTGDCRDVADPWYTGNFEATYRDVSNGCKALIKHITKTVGI